MKTLFTWLFFLLSLSLFSQQSVVLNLEDFLDLVNKNHPVMKQANLLDDQAEANWMKARGSFDPVISSSYGQKSFDGKNYYQKFDGILKIPLRFGVDLEMGYETNEGSFLNDENTVPENGLAYAGIRIPLGSGLFYDERRLILDQAKLYEESNALDRIQMINNLLFEALLSYLDWQFQVGNARILEEAVAIVVQRLDNIRASFQVGDRPAIDTIEASQNLRTRNIDLIKARQDLAKSRQSLNNFLWREDLLPLELENEVVPESIDEDRWIDRINTLRLGLNEILAKIPALRNYDLDRRYLEIERRLTREFLKPQVDLKVHPLIRLDSEDELFSTSANDYLLGVNISYPVFTRKNRGDLQLINYDLQNNQWAYDNKRQETTTKIENMFTNLQFLAESIDLVKENIRDSEVLLNTEYEKFEIGESSMFLINNRENKLVQDKRKLLLVKRDILFNRLGLMHQSAELPNL